MFQTGAGSLSLTFTGELNDKMKGFYRSKYKSADGKEDRYCAVTQFEVWMGGGSNVCTVNVILGWSTCIDSCGL